MARDIDRGNRIRHARRQAGLSQLQLAEQCEVDLKTARNWESGTYRPEVDNQPKLAKALKLPLIELLALLDGLQKEPSIELPKLSDFSDVANSPFDLLRQRAQPPTSTPAFAGSQAIPPVHHGLPAGSTAPELSTAATVLERAERIRCSMDAALGMHPSDPTSDTHWAQLAHDYARVYQTVPSPQLLADVFLSFSGLQPLIAQRPSHPNRTSLCRSAAELATVSGILLAALGHPRRARAWFHTAKLAADEASDARLAGLAAVRSATVSLYYGAPTVALEQARRARTILGRTTSASAVRALLVEARALAKLQRDTDAARRLIDDAEVSFGKLTAEEQSNMALGFTERQFYFTAGTAYTHLGLYEQANDMQTRALQMYRPTEYLDRALIRLDQATCLVLNGHADAGCHLAATTLEGATQHHRASLITHYGHEFYDSLTPAVRHSRAALQLRALLLTEG